jgi:hypothetical protein
VCGTDYSPAVQASSEPYDYTPGPELRDILGDEKFRSFAKQFLIRQGMPEAQAIENVEKSEAAAITSKKQIAENQRKAKARERYIEQSLYAGLKQDSIADPYHPGKVLGNGFAAEDFEELMRRCSERGIRILGLSHISLNEQLERREFPMPPHLRRKFDPVSTFNKWRDEGCNELFEGIFRIPEQLIEAFEKEHPAEE